MNPFEMVVLIVAIAVFGTMMKERYKQRARSGDPQSAAENDRLRAEIADLKDRIVVLERLATDKRSRLADEIDALGAPDRRP